MVCLTLAGSQETLRTEFSDRTLLAVAHRLHTIIEADRCLGRRGDGATAFIPACSCALLLYALCLVVDACLCACAYSTAHISQSSSGMNVLQGRAVTIVCVDVPCCGRVLVMDKGRALEYGRPADLLQKDDGAFTGGVGRSQRTAA